MADVHLFIRGVVVGRGGHGDVLHRLPVPGGEDEVVRGHGHRRASRHAGRHGHGIPRHPAEPGRVGRAAVLDYAERERREDHPCDIVVHHMHLDRRYGHGGVAATARSVNDRVFVVVRVVVRARRHGDAPGSLPVRRREGERPGPDHQIRPRRCICVHGHPSRRFRGERDRVGTPSAFLVELERRLRDNDSLGVVVGHRHLDGRHGHAPVAPAADGVGQRRRVVFTVVVGLRSDRQALGRVPIIGGEGQGGGAHADVGTGGRARRHGNRARRLGLEYHSVDPGQSFHDGQRLRRQGHAFDVVVDYGHRDTWDVDPLVTRPAGGVGHGCASIHGVRVRRCRHLHRLGGVPVRRAERKLRRTGGDAVIRRHADADRHQCHGLGREHDRVGPRFPLIDGKFRCIDFHTRRVVARIAYHGQAVVHLR